MTVPALQLAGVSKSFGSVVALRDLDLSIEPGEVLALIGPNGAGKTTLIGVAAGLHRPDRGTVRVLGSEGAPRARLGLAPQDLGVYPGLTSRENLVLFGELAGLRGSELADRIDGVATALGLRLTSRVRTLSGGERRRLHVALAILHNPPLVLLDEPANSLDPEARAQLFATVRRLSDDGSAVVYSTNQLAEAEALDASVAILDGGRLVARGRLDELVAANASPTVRVVFEGPVPPVPTGVRVEVVGPSLVIRTEAPETAIAPLLTALGPEARRVMAIEVVRPGLEGAFLALTGRRYQPEGDGAGVAVA